MDEITYKLKQSLQKNDPLISLFIQNNEELLTTNTLKTMWKYYNGQTDDNYPEKYKIVYKKTIKTLFDCYIKNCFDNDYCQMYFSFNNVNLDNICIVKKENDYLILTIQNNRSAVEHMNSSIKNYGQYCHVLITN